MSSTPNPEGSASNVPPSNIPNRPFHVVPGSLPYRHGWNYPANDLNAIYSDVIMNTHLKPDFAYSPSQNSSYNARHGYVIDDVTCQRPLDHCLPIPAEDISHYQKVGANESLRRSAGCKDAKKRFSASALSSSIPRPLVRSSSADFLSNETVHPASLQQDKEAANHVNKNNTYNCGEVSMLETQEIIENIEKLLNS